MLKKTLARVGLIIGSVVMFYALLVLGILLPLLHQENFQDFLKRNLNQRILAPLSLKLNYAHMAISLVPLSLTLSNVELTQTSFSSPSDRPQLHISTAQAKIRVSFSRLLLGRLYIKFIDLQNPQISLQLSSPENSPQNLTSLDWDWWQSDSPLSTLGHVLHAVTLNEGQVALSLNSQSHLNIKQLNATVYFSPYKTDCLWDLQHVTYVDPQNEVQLESFKGKTTWMAHRLIVHNLMLTHVAGLLALERASVELGKSYDLQNLSVGVSANIVPYLAKIKFLPFPSELQTFQGHLKLTATVQGQWNHFPTGQAHLETQGFQYGSWALENVKLPLTLSPDRLLIQEGQLSGFYGQLIIPKLALTLTHPFSFQGLVTPHQLHFSSFMRLAKITGCLSFFDLSGPIELEGTFAPFHLQGQAQFDISEFFVPPTVAEAKDETKTIIRFPHATLTGNFSITQNLTTFHKFIVNVDQTQLLVTGTIVHDPIDVNLDIETNNIHLGHLKTIGKLPVAGQGPLKAHLQANDIGLFIQGEVNLTEAGVDSYHLPHVQARVAYADEKLHFQNVSLIQEGTNISADVWVNLEQDITFKIDAKIQQADAAFLKTFLGPNHEFYLKYLTSGVFFGTLTLQGPADLNVLAGQYQLQARNIRFAGEGFQEMRTKATFGHARMDFQNFWLQKGNSKVQVQGKLGPGPQYDLHFSSDPIPLSTFYVISSHNASATGSAIFQGQVSGPFATPNIHAVLSVPNALLGTTPLPEELRFELNTKNQKWNFAIYQAGVQWGSVSLSVIPPKPFLLELNFKDMPWLAFLGLRFPHLLTSASSSKLSVSGKVSGHWDHFSQTTTGSLLFQQLSLSDEQNSLYLKTPLSLVLKKGKTTSSPSFWFEDTQTHPLKLSITLSDQKPFSAHAEGTLSAHWINLLTHLVTHMRGLLQGDLSVSRSPEGNWMLASTHGISSDQLVIQFPFMPEEVRFESFNASIQQGILHLKNLKGHFKEGTLTLKGTNAFHPKTFLPQPQLTLALQKARLSVPSWLTGIYTGSLTLGTGQGAIPFTLAGKLELSSGRNLQSFLGQSIQPTVFEQMLSREAPEQPLLNLDIELTLPPESFQAKYAFLTTPIGGHFLIKQSPENLQVSGVIRSSSGSLKFRNHEFTLQEFELRFDPTHLWKSRIFLQAQTTIQGYLIKLNTRGVLENYEYEFTSIPFLPKREVLALLLFGRQHADLTEADQAELLQIDVGNAIIQQMPLAESLEKETGLQFKIAPAAANTQASVSRITVSKKVSKNLEAQVTTDLGDESNRAFALEYDLSHRVSVRGSLQEQGPSSRQVQSPQSLQRVGLDVRVKSEFD